MTTNEVLIRALIVAFVLSLALLLANHWTQLRALLGIPLVVIGSCIVGALGAVALFGYLIYAFGSDLERLVRRRLNRHRREIRRRKAWKAGVHGDKYFVDPQCRTYSDQ